MKTCQVLSLDLFPLKSLCWRTGILSDLQSLRGGRSQNSSPSVFYECTGDLAPTHIRMYYKSHCVSQMRLKVAFSVNRRLARASVCDDNANGKISSFLVLLRKTVGSPTCIRQIGVNSPIYRLSAVKCLSAPYAIAIIIWETFRRQTSTGYPSYLQNRRCRYFPTTLLTDDGFSAYGILSNTVRNGWLYAEQ